MNPRIGKGATRPALTIRARLTLLYAAALSAAGALMLAFSYFVVKTALDRAPGEISGVDLPLRSRALPWQFSQEITGRVIAFKEQTLRELLQLSAIALVVVVILAATAAWWMAGRALTPIRRITATAASVSGGALNRRIAHDGPGDEVKQLADTFDAMLSRLDQAFDAQRRFVANASHELRTPLAVERTVIEVALANPAADDDLRRLGTTLLAVHERSERLIEGLLALARGEGAPRNDTRVDLRAVILSAVAMFRPEADQKDIRITTELQPAEITGDPDLLDQLCLNVVQNAIRHNVGSGWVRIGLTCRTRPARNTAAELSQVLLTVENTGPIIDPAVVPGLFEPFRRGRARTGNGIGLGLSLAVAAAKAHSGTITAAARPDGGLTLVTTLPRDRAPTT